MISAELVKERMRPLFPHPSGVDSRLVSLPGIKAVVFDIYGTLIISAAGDISLVSETQSIEGMKTALAVVGGEGDEELAQQSLVTYREAISNQQAESKAGGVEFPEVEIRDVWAVIAAKAGLSDRLIEVAALEYECAVNPCWEMPGAAELITLLKSNSIPLGIISNAQFYTHDVVAGLLGVGLEAPTFDADLSVFSYLEREGKPSRRLFQKVVEAAERRGLQSGEVLYVGNDFKKDIEPAQEVGFRTAFFAGDSRSFRTGEVPADEACDFADVVLTDLMQLVDVLGLKL